MPKRPAPTSRPRPPFRRRILVAAAAMLVPIGVATGFATESAAAAPVTTDDAVLEARVGQRVPDVTLPDLTGAPRSLTELRGQRAMLHVFASW